MQKIFFLSADKVFYFSEKKKLKKFILEIFKKERKQVTVINYVFCSDEYLLKINELFLHHNYYTDILTFNLSSAAQIEGEIYISLDRVKENASIEKTTYQSELLRVVFHGVLHLCGYNDKKKNEILLMRKKENHYIRLYMKNK